MPKRRVKTSKVIPGDGDPCNRCRRPTQIVEHIQITTKHLAQPYYYSRWFVCTHADCRTNVIMPERYKVERRGDVEVWDEPADLAALIAERKRIGSSR